MIDKGEDPAAICPICPHACALQEGQLGLCGARRCEDGRVIDENYGRITAMALDPIEKKPLAFYEPGTRVLSVGSYGCNLNCGFCQNASIACARADDIPWRFVSPESLIEEALDLKDRSCIGIAYTYNEPLIGYEYVLDCSRLAHEAGLINVVVSNGMVNQGPLEKLVPYIDAANIDLKGFDQGFYDMVGGNLESVKRTIARLAQAPNCHLEVTTLVIPGMNDDPATIEAASAWLASLDPSIPYHLTRFFPCHRFAHRQPTPLCTLRELKKVAERNLSHVVLGNC